MIKLQLRNGEQVPLKVEDDEWYITQKANGMDTLTFVINSKDDSYIRIAEESVVYAYDNMYTVKNIDEHDSVVTVDCVVDVSDWRKVFYSKYSSGTQGFDNYMKNILPTGWTYSTFGDFSEKKAIGVDRYNAQAPIKGKTKLELFTMICDLWDAAPRFNAVTKVVTVVQKDAVGFSREFYSDEINLKSLGYVGNSTDLATRVYWYGKEQSDGRYLTMAEANNGLYYVADNTYTDKVITYGYIDTAIDNPYDLYNKAIEYLKTHCKPTRSYQLQVREVPQDLQLFSTVLIIDSVNRTQDYHQVVEMKVYPECHTLDSVTLDSLVPDNARYYKNGIYIPESDMDNTKLENLSDRVTDLENNSGSTTYAGKVGGPDNGYGSIGVYNAQDAMDLRIDKFGIKGAIDYSKDAIGENSGSGHFAIGETVKPTGTYSYLSETYLPYCLIEKPADGEAANIADGIGRIVVGGYNGMTKDCLKSSAETPPNEQPVTSSQQLGYNIPMRIHGIVDIDPYRQAIPFSENTMNTDVLNVRYGIYRFLHTKQWKSTDTNNQHYETDLAQGAVHVNADETLENFKTCRTDFVRLGNVDKPKGVGGTYNTYTLVNNLVLQGDDNKCYKLNVVGGELNVEALSDVTVDDFK